MSPPARAPEQSNDTEISISLLENEVAEHNQDLIRESERALWKNTAAGLMALIPESYRRKHGRTQLEILKQILLNRIKAR